MTYEPLVAVTRGDLDESIHYAAVVVANAEGQIVASAGSPATITYMRSSAKPLQVLPLIESGAADHFRLTPSEIAVVIASHSGEPRHVDTVRGILAKIGLGPDHLMCGTHTPFHRPTARRLAKEGTAPSVLHSNCSGKHSGMLALAVFRGVTPAGYFLPEHPVQREILGAVASMAGCDPSRIPLGVDGCTVPTFGLSLAESARAYAKLMEPESFQGPRRLAAHRVVDAMMAHPEMVAGEGRLDTDLMIAAQGQIVAKAGAEGYYCVGFRRKGKGYGLAVKVSDGDNDRARSAILLRAMGDLQLLTDDRIATLRETHLPPIKNRRGDVVGRVEARFSLEMPD